MVYKRANKPKPQSKEIRHTVQPEARSRETGAPETKENLAASREEVSSSEKSQDTDVVYRGMVTDLSGQPISNVQVRSDFRSIWSPAEDKIAEAKTRTDASGNFKIGPLPPAEEETELRVLIFEHSSYAIAWFEPAFYRNDPWISDVQNVHIKLVPPTVVAGTVNDQEGNPVPNATVEADIQFFSEWGYGYLDLDEYNGMAATTDAKGRFLFEKIPEGARLHLAIKHKQYVTHDTWDEWHADEQPVRAGTRDFNVTLNRGGSIEGQLMLNGKPYKQRNVPVITKSDSWDFTDDEGRFTLTGLSEGRYVVYARYDTLAETGLVCMPRADIDVKAGKASTFLELDLCEERILAGVISDQKRNNPAPDIRISAATTDNEITLCETRTDKNGNFRLRLPPGDYKLRVGSYREDEQYNVHVPEKGPVSRFAMTILTRSLIKGRLLDANNQETQGFVHLGRKTVGTNDDGSFSVPEPRIHSGKEAVVGFALDRQRKLSRCFLWSPEDIGKELEIVLAPPATITGRLIDETGTAQSKASLILGFGGSGFLKGPWKTEFQPDGRFTISNVPTGQSMGLHPEKRGFGAAMTDIPNLKPGRILNIGDVVIYREEDFKDADIEWNRTLSGRILDENNKPLGGVRVWTFFDVEDVTDFKGYYHLTGLPKGQGFELNLTWWGPDYDEQYRREVKVGPEAGENVDFHISPEDP